MSNSGLGCVAVGSSVTVLAEGLTRVQSAFTTGKETAHSREVSVSLMAQQFFGTFERSNWRPFLGSLQTPDSAFTWQKWFVISRVPQFM